MSYYIDHGGLKRPLEETTGPEPAVDSTAIANSEDTTKKPKHDETIQKAEEGNAPIAGTVGPVESEPESAFEVFNRGEGRAYC
jgi:hypothetical protein